MNWFKKLFEKDDWRFVGKVNSKYKITNKVTGTHLSTYELIFYLYENQHGERKFDVIDTDPDRGNIDVDRLSKNDWVFRCAEYVNVVHPWLNGFRNKKFPTYDKAPMHDMKRFLEEE